MKDITPEISRVASQYRFSKPPDFLVFLQELLEKINKGINDLLSLLHIHPFMMNDASAVANGMQTFLLLAGILAVAVIVYFAFTRMKQLTQESRLATKGQDAAEHLFDSAGWREEAERLAGQRHYKEACRASYLALLRLLDEQSILEFMPTRSNYEYWYALASREELARDFKKLSDLVDLVWFGNKLAGPQDYQLCRDRLERITSYIVPAGGNAE
ncbi:MAG TPA: DUF4129 domain-containing protein [Chroococcales cyanobacterium]